MIIDNQDHKFLHPWGTPIYTSQLNTEELKFFQDQAEAARTKSDAVGSRLAGNIKEQFGADNQEASRFKDILHPHIINYLKHEITRMSQLQGFLKPKYRDPVYPAESASYNLGLGPWFNFMKKGEFNPLHGHTGNISGIIMIKVPTEIALEDEIDSIESNLRCPGQLEWVYEQGSHKVSPKEGEIYLFDARLRHQVYPFTSNVERITSSFNVQDIQYPNTPEN